MVLTVGVVITVAAVWAVGMVATWRYCEGVSPGRWGDYRWGGGCGARRGWWCCDRCIWGWRWELTRMGGIKTDWRVSLR